MTESSGSLKITVQIELKALSINPRRAMEQIVEYKNDPGNGYTKTLLCFLQLFIVSNRNSKRIGTERIAEEGYNLNISRYISTATADEEIDLEVINAKLREMEKKIKDAKDKHNDFLGQLGLPNLP